MKGTIEVPHENVPVSPMAHRTGNSSRMKSHRGAVFSQTRNPQSVPVAGIGRDIRVKIAATADEWEQAFHLVSTRYKEMGYVPPSARGMHFMPHHALPDTVTLIAKERERVVATVSLIPDSRVLGLPMEEIYADEITSLRRAGHFPSEVSCLADTDLSPREFMHVFVQLSRLLLQYSAAQGSCDLVISVNPRHVRFYQKFWGFTPLGPRRVYSAVEGAPAEAFYVDRDLMARNAPQSYATAFGEPLPAESLIPVSLPPVLARRFARHSYRTDLDTVNNLLENLRRSTVYAAHAR